MNGFSHLTTWETCLDLNDLNLRQNFWHFAASDDGEKYTTSRWKSCICQYIIWRQREREGQTCRECNSTSYSRHKHTLSVKDASLKRKTRTSQRGAVKLWLTARTVAVLAGCNTISCRCIRHVLTLVICSFSFFIGIESRNDSSIIWFVFVIL